MNNIDITIKTVLDLYDANTFKKRLHYDVYHPSDKWETVYSICVIYLGLDREEVRNALEKMNV